MLTAVVMVGAAMAGNGPAVWVQQACRMATRDLLEQLRRQPLIEQIVLISPENDQLVPAGADHFFQTRPGAIHFGEQLTEVIQKLNLERILYFGGGSAPLLSDEMLAEMAQQVSQANPLLITNNQFATDWAALAPAGIVADWVSQLPRDNMLGWVLSAKAGLPIQTLPAGAGTRLDIDTPVDLLTLRLYPHTKPHLRHYLATLPLDTSRLEAALAVLARPGSHVFISGRIAPDVWTALNKVSRCWLRVVSEERGMVSSGRQERGEARSLLAEWLTTVGLKAFFATLSQWAEAAFIDTRVLLAHYQRWPTDSGRYASDLGHLDDIDDLWLKAFTAEALTAPIPIILGGQSLISGDMFAFCDILWYKLPQTKG